METASSGSIKLRLITEEDAPLLYQLMTADNWLAHIGDRGISSIADARRYIQDRMHPELEEKGFINHVISDPQIKQELGTCSLHNREGVEGLDIGYAILEAFEDRGYATAAAKEMIKLAFEKYAEDQVSAITTNDNIGSCQVLEKIEFQAQGYVQLPDGTDKLRLYVLRKEGE